MNDQAPCKAFGAGDPVVFYDLRRRAFYAELSEGGSSNIRGDLLRHEDVIGQPNGVRLHSRRKQPFWAFFPTLPEYALSMTRSAAIIYPKDAAYLVMHADIGPGMRVVEGGFGSGSLTMALLRAVGQAGHVTTYELRKEAANRARKNIQSFLGAELPHTCTLGDIYEGINEEGVHRVILDVPEPWQVIPHAAEALIDGGILAAYLPTIIQVQTFMLELRAHPAFFTSEAVEVLERKWHVTKESVRPEQQMIGHTGFLCTSRRIARPRAE